MTAARAPGPQPVRAVLFDMDGLLIDSERLYTDVVNDVLRPYGKEQTWATKQKLMGRPERDATEILLGDLWPPRNSSERYNTDECPFDIGNFLKDRNDLLLKAFETVKPMPGAQKLVSHLARHGIPICVATGSKTPNYKIKSGANPDLFEPFKGRVVCGDDPRLARGKPQPDIFLLAARQGLGISDFHNSVREQGPEHDGTLKGDEGSILVFEDATNGVEAAIKAGMQVVWVPDDNLRAVVGDDIGATQTLTGGLEEFRPELFGLPPY
ncbi:unnamed protein product [Parajaminaea phylloscopi]